MKDSTNGLRLKRALNSIGSNYQEIRWNFASMINFDWNFDSSIVLS
jgi:hypothetical protein